MRLSFYGASRFVTGSCFMIEANNKKILIDCGLLQGREAKTEGLELPFKAEDVDYLLLTHAHIDHSGRIPLLVKDGFKGPIFATEATRLLSSIMLLDSAHIQETEAEWKTRKNKRSGREAVAPLYTKEDAELALTQFVGVKYETLIEIEKGISVRFIDAGHLLGSSSIEVFITEDRSEKKFVFSGDVGNLDQPIIKDPKYIESADYIIVESTYGDRIHEVNHTNRPNLEERARELAKIVDKTFKRGGNLIIPSFAVGRTQEMLYLFRIIMAKKFLPYDIPVFLDSPLSVKATNIFIQSLRGDYFDEEAMELIKKGINPVDFPSLVKIVDVEDSKALNFRKEPCVIISSSGMCDAGRIKHHLKHNLWKRESTVLFVGYQANGTLGRNIVDGAKHITIFSEQIDVRAEVLSFQGISGHADQSGLLKWLSAFEKKEVSKVFVVHGDENVAPLFAKLINEKLGLEAYAPELLESFDLSERLPIHKNVEFIDETRKTLEEAFDMLEKGRNHIDEVVKRMQVASKDIEAMDEKRAIRLANAINRLASDLEDLKEKWKSDAN